MSEAIETNAVPSKSLASPIAQEVTRSTVKPQVLVGRGGFVVADVEGAFRLATIYLAGGMVPDSTIAGLSRDGAVARVVALIEVAHSLGISPRAAFKGITSVRGNLLIWGDLTVALCARHAAWAGMEHAYTGDLAKGDRACTVTVHRRGCPSISHTFSQADAKRAGLGGKVWESYTDRMLFNRARSWALRDQFADALNGIGIGEENFLDQSHADSDDGTRLNVIDANEAFRALSANGIESLT